MQYVISLLFASFCYFLIIRRMFLNIIFMFVFFCLVFLFSISCNLRFYFVLFIVSPFGAVSFLFLNKSNDHSHKVEK